MDPAAFAGRRLSSCRKATTLVVTSCVKTGLKVDSLGARSQSTHMQRGVIQFADQDSVLAAAAGVREFLNTSGLLSGLTLLHTQSPLVSEAFALEALGKQQATAKDSKARGNFAKKPSKTNKNTNKHQQIQYIKRTSKNYKDTSQIHKTKIDQQYIKMASNITNTTNILYMNQTYIKHTSKRHQTSTNTTIHQKIHQRYIKHQNKIHQSYT